nr:RHS repeat protein [Escherichia coli]EMA1730340.1 RHS repeat protein [Escherichia coli]
MQMLDRLESEILADRVSEESRRWLASCGLTVEQIQNQMDPVYTPARKIHLYHCDHRGLPTIAACRWRLSARKGQQNGAQNTMNGATC